MDMLKKHARPAPYLKHESNHKKHGYAGHNICVILNNELMA